MEMNYMPKSSINDYIMFGPKILSENDFLSSFPYFEELKKEISIIKKNAKDLLDKKKESTYDEVYIDERNNVFSILGGRGSGKTSILLTINNMLKSNAYKNDIFLPILINEKMESNPDFLGCILGFFGSIVDKFSKQIDNDRLKDFEDKHTEIKEYYRKCRNEKNNILKNKYHEVLKQYRYTKKDYQAILREKYVGFTDYIERAKNTLDCDQKFLLVFKEFIDELILVNSLLKTDCEKNSGLIFLFIDDIDLIGDRCLEVINLMLRYLIHPSIVPVVACNIETFSEILNLSIIKRDNIIDVINIETSNKYINSISKSTIFFIISAFSGIPGLFIIISASRIFG
jgi:hypothetical protein